MTRRNTSGCCPGLQGNHPGRERENSHCTITECYVAWIPPRTVVLVGLPANKRQVEGELVLPDIILHLSPSVQPEKTSPAVQYNCNHTNLGISLFVHGLVGRTTFKLAWSAAKKKKQCMLQYHSARQFPAHVRVMLAGGRPTAIS